MSDVIVDLAARRKKAPPEAPCRWACRCGCEIMDLWDDGEVRCHYCGTIMLDLCVVHVDPNPAPAA